MSKRKETKCEPTLRETGYYAVVHYGPDGNALLPYMLCLPNVSRFAEHHYTNDIHRAKLFDDKGKAVACKETEQEYLNENHHIPLTLKVAELLVRDCEGV